MTLFTLYITCVVTNIAIVMMAPCLWFLCSPQKHHMRAINMCKELHVKQGQRSECVFVAVQNIFQIVKEINEE